MYLSIPSTSGPTFRFLGAVGEGKESAVFKISGITAGGPDEREVDMDAPEDGNPFPAGEITLGICCLLVGRRDGECLGEAGRSKIRTIPKGCGMG